MSNNIVQRNLTFGTISSETNTYFGLKGYMNCLPAYYDSIPIRVTFVNQTNMFIIVRYCLSNVGAGMSKKQDSELLRPPLGFDIRTDTFRLRPNKALYIKW